MTVAFVTRPATLAELIYMQQLVATYAAGEPSMEVLFNLMVSRAVDGTPPSVLLDLSGDDLTEACTALVESMQASLFLAKLSASLDPDKPATS